MKHQHVARVTLHRPGDTEFQSDEFLKQISEKNDSNELHRMLENPGR